MHSALRKETVQCGLSPIISYVLSSSWQTDDLTQRKVHFECLNLWITLVRPKIELDGNAVRASWISLQSNWIGQVRPWMSPGIVQDVKADLECYLPSPLIGLRIWTPPTWADTGSKLGNCQPPSCALFVAFASKSSLHESSTVPVQFPASGVNPLEMWSLRSC